MGEVARQNIPARVLRAGSTLPLGPDVRLDVLAPVANEAHPAETNDASLVLRLVYGSTAFLLLGDAQASAEAGLVARYGPLLRSTVVKVGHHGSRTSSTPPLVDAAAAPGCTAVVSVGRGNVYRLPSPEVVARWRHRCTTLLTEDEGAVWLRSDGHTVRRIDWR